ncbi:MAG: hypothetical protein DLM68_12070 [Hyphomicrobiales bacterium]|nr:MAG: hypothetical protein DLM68_12070 [Hyphomicrobiales bacterium]
MHFIALDAGRAGAAIIEIIINNKKLFGRRFTEIEPQRLEGNNPIESVNTGLPYSCLIRFPDD